MLLQRPTHFRAAPTQACIHTPQQRCSRADSQLRHLQQWQPRSVRRASNTAITFKREVLFSRAAEHPAAAPLLRLAQRTLARGTAPSRQRAPTCASALPRRCKVRAQRHEGSCVVRRLAVHAGHLLSDPTASARRPLDGRPTMYPAECAQRGSTALPVRCAQRGGVQDDEYQAAHTHC